MTESQVCLECMYVCVSGFVCAFSVLNKFVHATGLLKENLKCLKWGDRQVIYSFNYLEMGKSLL